MSTDSTGTGTGTEIGTTDYALLARDAYQDRQTNQTVELGGVKYRIFDHTDDPRTGYQGTAYQRVDTGAIVIAHRGSEFDRELLQDGGTDAGMVLTGLNAQAPDATAFTQRVMDKAHQQSEQLGVPYDVTVTGHSLGGTLAELTAARLNLKGETFNAYGAAGLLYGLPEGGHQVIDHIRAGDLVSAASPHFGEVRIYAAPQDIDTLSKAGYRDDSGPLSPRNPLKATDFSAHAIDNFVPDNKLLGHSIVSPGNAALYQEHKGMIDRYREDVRDIRTVLSAPWEVPRAVVHGVEHVAQEVGEKVSAGVHAVGNAVSHAVHEVEEKLEHFGDRASHALHTLTHPGEWHHAKPPLDQPGHPDHALFQQARDAVHVLDASHHRASDQRSDNLSGALVVASRQAGLERIDRVVLSDDGSRAYAVQGDLNSPFKRVAEVPTQQAVNTPLERSSAQLEQAAAQKQQAGQPGQQQGPVAGQPQHQGA
jgi:hypothetical protein